PPSARRWELESHQRCRPLALPGCCFLQPSSELQPTFARGIGQRLDAAMEQVAAAIEYDGCHTGLLRCVGDFLANLDCRIDICPGLFRAECRSCSHGTALAIVDDLRINVASGAMNRETRLAARTVLQGGAHTTPTALE